MEIVIANHDHGGPPDGASADFYIKLTLGIRQT